MVTSLLQMLTIVTLLVLFFQDMQSRSVHWPVFPVLAGLFITVRQLAGEPLLNIGQSTLMNLAFIVLQLLLVTIYFSFKSKRIVNITGGLLGWGDVLFLVSTAFLFPTVSFVFFYVSSLILVLLGWGIFLYLRTKEEGTATIPLAGLQALLLAAAMLVSWLFPQAGLVKLTRGLQMLNLWS